jgi:hypothetical protein
MTVALLAFAFMGNASTNLNTIIFVAQTRKLGQV